MNGVCADSLGAENDTITAVATPIGSGGIGIVRISGACAHAIAARLFRPRNPPAKWVSQRLYYGHVADPASGEDIDEVLVAFMRAPRSYTCEDYVEIHSHGGYAVLSRILQMALDAGARLAKPGEFTLRAFLNGRIDLTQAEAVMDVINSRSERGLVLASRQLKGGLRVEVESLRDAALSLLAQVEASIDFPDEDGTGMDVPLLTERIRDELVKPVKGLIRAHDRSRVWVEGVGTAIVGRVNAGKSSLLNRLAEEERAIVTAAPGTTRDVIESMVNLEGLPLRLMDTAGFRRARNEAEKMGLQRSHRKIDEADLLLLVIDQSRPLGAEDLQLLDRCRAKNVLVVLNKIDLPPAMDSGAAQHLADFRTVRVSALTGEGMKEMRSALRTCALAEESQASISGIAPNARHKHALETALTAFDRAMGALKTGQPSEIVAFELQSGLEALSGIVGEVPHEDLLNEIFSRFCIGK